MSSRLFTALQHAHTDLAHASEQYDDLCLIDEAHPKYKLIKAHYETHNSKRPISDTLEELEVLKKKARANIDHYAAEEAGLFDKLSDKGYDMHTFYAECYIQPDVSKAEKDVDAIRIRKAADAELARKNPVEVKESDFSSRIKAIGASGYAHKTREEDEDKEEAADCILLTDDDKVLENDIQADRLAMYTAANDANEMDEAIFVYESGAVWRGGFRVEPELQAALHPHQQEGLIFMLDNLARGNGTILAHAMGLGKTATVLAALHVYSRRRMRCIVTCPKGMVQPWMDEVDKWRAYIDIGAYPVTSLDAIKRDIRPWKRSGGLFILSHDLLRMWLTDGPMPDEVDTEQLVVVVDEAHLLLKSAATQMYKAIDALRTNRLILMTGTAMQNNLTEFYTMINLCAPGLLGASIVAFNKVYGIPIQDGMMKDSTEAQQRLSERTVWMLRKRCEELVMHCRSAELLHKTLEKKLEFRVLHPGNSSGVHDDLPILQQRHHVAVDNRDGKTEVTLGLIDSIQSSPASDSIVVFSPYTDTLKHISQLRPGSVYTGETCAAKREEYMKKFREVPGSILYVSTKAGGVGINLTTGNRVIIVDASWNPADDQQAISRCFRLGQDKPVYVYRLIANNTLELCLYDRQVQKSGMAANILDAKDMLRNYFKSELRSSGRKEEASVMTLGQLMDVDYCLMDFIAGNQGGIKISDHSSMFADTTTDLQMDALTTNDMNRCVRDAPRQLLAPDNSIEVIHPNKLHFSDGTLVPSYPPVIESAGQFSNYLIEKVAPLYLRLGPYPYVANGGKSNYSFEVEYCDSKQDIASRAWKSWKLDDAGSEKVSCPYPPSGTYICRARLVPVVASEKISGWSTDSAEFTVV